MAEYIEREHLLRKFNVDDMMNVNGTLILLNDARNVIEKQPAADVAPVVHGRWRQTSKGVVYCSNCGTVCGIGAHIDEVTEGLNFCPNCGARMDGESNGKAD